MTWAINLLCWSSSPTSTSLSIFACSVYTILRYALFFPKLMQIGGNGFDPWHIVQEIIIWYDVWIYSSCGPLGCRMWISTRSYGIHLKHIYLFHSHGLIFCLFITVQGPNLHLQIQTYCLRCSFEICIKIELWKWIYIAERCAIRFMYNLA